MNLLDLEVPCEKHKISYGTLELCAHCVKDLVDRVNALEARKAPAEVAAEGQKQPEQKP